MNEIKVAIHVEGASSCQEASDLLECGIATIWRMIKDQKITAVKIGGKTYVPKWEIERLKNGGKN